MAISKTKECYVYVTLPGQTEPVTAGRFVVDYVKPHAPVGIFVYRKSYLDRDDFIPLDPVNLPHREEQYEQRILDGLFGAFRDASPDFWGRQVIDRSQLAQGGAVGFTDFDYLLNGPEDRVGALSFGTNVEPPPPVRDFSRRFNLTELMELATKIEGMEVIKSSSAQGTQAEQLLLARTSMGGARPKASVWGESDGKLWLAKFKASKDRWNDPRVEHATLLLAKACSIRVVNTHVETIGGSDVLFSERFDRDTTDGLHLMKKKQVISGLTVLNDTDVASARTRWSYPLLATEIRKFSAKPDDDARELYRRMVFNALITNTDDHPRNHALMMDGRGWRLSPAYDLTPRPAISATRQHAMSVGKDAWGNPSSEGLTQTLLSQSNEFCYPQEEAKTLIISMSDTIQKSWEPLFLAEGVKQVECDMLRSAFTPEVLLQGVEKLRKKR